MRSATFFHNLANNLHAARYFTSSTTQVCKVSVVSKGTAGHLLSFQKCVFQKISKLVNSKQSNQIQLDLQYIIDTFTIFMAPGNNHVQCICEIEYI